MGCPPGPWFRVDARAPMSGLNRLNEILKKALAIAQEDSQKALELLSDGLVEARQAGDRRSVSLLAKHGGLLSAENGNNLAAVDYYQEALSDDSRNAYLHLPVEALTRTLAPMSRLLLRLNGASN